MKTKIIFHPFDRLVMMDCCHSGMESMGRYEGKEKFKVFDEDHNDKRFSGRFSHEDRGKRKKTFRCFEIFFGATDNSEQHAKEISFSIC